VYLSPLHGALVAAVVANRGLWRDPVLFEPPQGAPPPAERVLSPEVAQAMADMLEETVTRGTARRIFRERNFRVPGAVGKTGTLADRQPFRDYSWFVGFAPKEAPRVAVGAVIVNDPLWRIRATWLGREALRLGLARVPAAPGTPPALEETPLEDAAPVAGGATPREEEGEDEEQAPGEQEEAPAEGKSPGGA
jgi:membrane peptidoglycan carboxypeptidase